MRHDSRTVADYRISPNHTVGAQRHVLRDDRRISSRACIASSIDEILSLLEDCYKKVMLEHSIPHLPLLLKCFVNGAYYFNKGANIRVDVLKSFLDLFKASSREKRNIILSNIQTKLDSLSRYSAKPAIDDDIPF